MKIPLYPDEDKAEKLIETPRALLQDLEPIQNDYFDGNASGSASIAALGLKEENSLVRIVPADYSVNMQIDRKQIMADIAQESRAIATLAIDTALDITRVIRGRKGKDERTIAKILAEKLQVDPSILNLPPLKSSESDYRVSLYPYHTADETESTDSVFQAAKDGKLISDTGSAVESDLAGQLLELGMGSERSDRESRQLNNEIIAMPRITEGVGESSTDLLNLGLNGNIHEDDEHIAYNEFNDRNDTVKRIAHEKYSEAREQDLMTIEEQISIGYENEMEDKNCREFMSKLQHLIQANTAFEEDKRQLQVLGSVIKPINLVDIMVGLSSSWEKIEIIIAETKSREFERQQLEERMKSEEGMRRQQTILDHSEDIEEMTNFLKNQANQSKINARRVATELILKNISTPKKLAKIWNRKHIDLKDFALDHDDIEELETALTKLLMDASAMGDSFIANRAVVPSGVINNQLILDPNMVTEVVDDYEDDQNSPSHAGNKSLQQGSLHSPSMRKDSHYHFTYTADGYKSFKGGWIEGVDNENNVYYYNTVTGGSSWTLPPDLTEEYDSNSHLVGSQLSVVSEHFEHYHGPYDLQNREVHEPANNFSDVYSDEHLQNYGYHAGQDDNQYDGSYHYQGEESNNNNESNYNYPDEYGDSNHQYDGTIQNYDENYYDPNTHYDGNEGVLTEHHSYEPYEGYTDIGDPNHYDNQENYDNYYNGDPNHYESTNDNNDGVWDAHEAYPDGNVQIQFASILSRTDK